MKILTKEEMKKMPNGTLFVEVQKNSSILNSDGIKEKHFIGNIGVTSNIMLLTGHHNDDSGWNGALSLAPDTNCFSDESTIVCNWCTWDNSDADYVDDIDYFAVFEPNEIKAMIKILETALLKEFSLINHLLDADDYYVNNKKYNIEGLQQKYPDINDTSDMDDIVKCIEKEESNK